MKKHLLISVIFLCILNDARSQRTRISIATDFGLQRNFKKEQKFWALGHTVHGLFHFTKTDAAYTWVSYYTNGHFSNRVIAIAKSTTVTPQIVFYTNQAIINFKQVSLGWRKYIKGHSENEDSWNIYAYAGFGLMLGRVSNIHDPALDSAVYYLPVVAGNGAYKRLTLDLGAGWEQSLGAEIFFYTECRIWIPTTDYPSRYMFVNNKAPFTAMLSAGLRFLF